jgi:hypothetical protein
LLPPVSSLLKILTLMLAVPGEAKGKTQGIACLAHLKRIGWASLIYERES